MYDVDLGVAVAGLHLLRLLFQQEVVVAKEVADVYKLLGDQSPALRNAAAALVVLLLEDQGQEVWKEQKERASSQQVGGGFVVGGFCSFLWAHSGRREGAVSASRYGWEKGVEWKGRRRCRGV